MNDTIEFNFVESLANKYATYLIILSAKFHLLTEISNIFILSFK